MQCQDMTVFRNDRSGVRHVVADLLASTVPDTMPTTGKGIIGLKKSDILEAGSTLYIVNTGALYMMNEEHEFKEQ